MRILTLCFLFCLTFAVQAACEKKIDESKVMLFVDTNDSDLEIEKAEQAACMRGQRLVIVPKNYQSYNEAIVPLRKLKEAANSCSAKNSNDMSKCDEHFKKVAAAQEKLNAFIEAKTPTFTDELKQELDGLQKSGVSLENVTLSGHDGGGTYGGYKATLMRDEFLKIFSQYPTSENVKSIMLLGCYTAVPNEINSWVGTFPNVRMIAGYDNSAPLSSRPSGHEYYYDLLTQEKKLTSTADQTELQQSVEQIRSLKDLNAAMYFKPSCDVNPEGKAFYYGVGEKGRAVRDYDVKECEKSKDKLQILHEKLSKYYNGLIEPPKDTSKGELRDLYSQTRRYQHCYKTDDGEVSDADIAFGLLFQDGVKANFVNFYKDDLAEAQKNLLNTPQSEFDKSYAVGLRLLKEDKEWLDSERQDVRDFETNPAQYVVDKEKELKNRQDEYQKIIADPKYKKLITKFPELAGGNQGLNFPYGPEERFAYDELMGYLRPLNTLKWKLDDIKKDSKNFIVNKKKYLAEKEDEYKDKEKKTVRVDANVLKTFWVPTKENLKGKTRKQIMENLYKMSGLLTGRTLPEQFSKNLSWVKDVTSNHLDRMKVPFSWHEFTGATEKPAHSSKLADYIKTSPIFPGF